MTSRQIQTILVPTVRDAPAEEPTSIDIRRLSDDDLRTLERSDPFMYHSIPSVHCSRPSLVNVEKSTARVAETSYQVLRKTRVSTECHMTMLLQEFIAAEESFDEMLQ